MSTMWFSRHKVFTGAMLSLVAIWFALFEWNWIVFTDGGPDAQERCYSPNHEYYIVRLQTPFRALMRISLDPIGTAKLYDKTGNLLYQGKAWLDFQGGPKWSRGLSAQGDKPVAYFMDLDGEDTGDGWMYYLPSSPGEYHGKLEKHCF